MVLDRPKMVKQLNMYFIFQNEAYAALPMILAIMTFPSMKVHTGVSSFYYLNGLANVGLGIGN